MKLLTNFCFIELMFIAVFLLISPGISTGQTRIMGDHRQEFDIHRQSNGKYTASVAMHHGPVTGIIRSGQDKETKKEFQPRLSKPDITTHHIAFHFDISLGMNMLICAGTDTCFSDMVNMTWTNSTTVEADMPDGYYEMIGYIWNGPGKDYYILKHNFHVYQDMDTTLLSTSAYNKVTLTGVDENGNPLHIPFGSSGGFGVGIELPDGCIIPFFSSTSTGVSPDNLMFTEVAPEMKLLFNSVYVTEGQHYHQYLISYPAIEWLYYSTTLVNSPSDLHPFRHILTSTPTGQEYYLGWGYGIIANDSLIGYQDSFVLAFLNNGYPGHARDTVMLYLTHSAADTNKLLYASNIYHLENSVAVNGAMSSTSSALTYLDKNNQLVFTVEGNYPPVDCDYTLAPGNTATIANTAPYNLTWQMNQVGQAYIGLKSHYRSQCNDRRYADVIHTTYEIWNTNTLLFRDTMTNFTLTYYPSTLGVYKVVQNDSNYTLHGKQGFNQTLTIFDLANQKDVCPPTMIAFKVLQNGIVSPDVVRGFPASVRLTAADYEYTTTERVFHSLGDAQFFWKKYEDTDWSQLTLDADPGGFDSISGMPYQASLAPLMSATSDSVFIDLMVMLVDSTGNSITQIIHPAFLLRDIMTGINTGALKTALNVFPNPTTGRFTIETGLKDQPVTVTLTDATGREIRTQQFTGHRRSFDSGDLLQGTYILKVTTGNTVQYIKLMKM